MFYPVKTPWLFSKVLYPAYVWGIPGKEKIIYLTYDDGPHPKITDQVLDVLKQYEAKATFFCIGKNVLAHPATYQRIIEEGHGVGNHTQDHLNGWDVNNKIYLKSIHEASKHIDSRLFRPPYGRLTGFQAQQVIKKMNFHVVMWSVLSGDFDIRLSPEDCLKNVIRATRQGSIVVFHDSEKALKRMSYALPKTIEYFMEKGFVFEKISI
jgi:peptidoglycan/xylan/chitin deacetylase (PgdA/CDA1 family)